MVSNNRMRRGRALRIVVGTLLIFLAIGVATSAASEVQANNITLTEVGHFGGISRAVDVSGNYAYFSQGYDFTVLDITSKIAPVEIGRVSTKGLIQDIAIFGNYAYVADGG